MSNPDTPPEPLHGDSGLPPDAVIGIAGLGLIGASLAAALKTGEAPPEVLGYDRLDTSISTAISRGYIDAGATSLAELARRCDLVVLAVPVLSLENLFSELGVVQDTGHLMPVVTDVGSVKGVVVAAANRVFGHLPDWLVPGHPIAGSEFSGVTAADAFLFRNHQVILTPHTANPDRTVQAVAALWERVGAQVEVLTVSRHDEVLAATSHLPHLLAFTLVDSLARESEKYEIFHYAAGGFRDFTRIAASDPVMWHDVFMANDRATLDVLDRFMNHLADVRRMLDQRDGHELQNVFVRAKHARDYFSRLLDDRNGGGEQRSPEGGQGDG